MQRLTPNMAVKDVAKSSAFYRDVLGFELLMAVAEEKSGFDTDLDGNKHYIWAMLKHGGVEVMLQEDTSLKEDVGDFFSTIGASITLYINVEDVEAYYHALQENVAIVKPLETTWYGMREFYIRDCNGYILAFATQEAE